MLTAIRKHTGSVVVKILAGVLVASFALWGIGDMFGPTYSGTAAFEVDEVAVEPRELETDIRREINRLRPILGNQFTIDQARSMGLVETVLQRRINDIALSLAAGDLGVEISDDIVRAEIRANPAFQGLGGFDRERFQRLLYDQFLTETEYVRRSRLQIGRDQLIAGFGAETAPAAMVRAVYGHEQEKRIVDSVTIADADQHGVPEPDDAALRKYYLDRAVYFTNPEYRRLTVLSLRAADLASEITITEKALRNEYEARLDEFTTVEKRHLLQMITNTEDDAKRAGNLLAEGRDFAAVAKEVAGLDAATIDLGTITRHQLPFPELAKAAFGIEKGAHSAPVESPLGWHLFRAEAIEPGGVKTFDAVRGALAEGIAREKAIDSLFELANRLEDLLGGGATLEEAARELHLPVRKIDAIDRDGKDGQGQPVTGLPGGDFLAAAFATEEGADSLLTETGNDGYFILRVDDTTPPALPPFESVRPRVVAAWKADARAEKAKQAATALVARLDNGAALGPVAAEMGLGVKTSPPVTRQGGGADAETGLPMALVTRIFGVKLGQAAMARDGAGYAVAQVKEIIAADPGLDRDGLDTLNANIGGAIKWDIMVQLAEAFRERFGVSVNRRAIDELFAGTAGSRGPGPGR